MKKVFFLMLIAGIALSGCKKDDNKPANSGSFQVEGTTINVTDMLWFDISVQMGDTENTSYSISSYGNSDNDLLVQLSDKKTGEITIDEGNNVELTVGEDSYVSVSGTISITKFDDKAIQGTFTGKFVKNDGTEQLDASGSFLANKLTLDI